MNLGKYELNKIYNEDCYEAIKNIPNKSIDLVYIDIPYLYGKTANANSKSELNKRILKMHNQDLKTIRDGIDYSLFDELVRIMKHIYIYIYGVAKNKFTI